LQNHHDDAEWSQNRERVMPSVPRKKNARVQKNEHSKDKHFSNKRRQNLHTLFYRKRKDFARKKSVKEISFNAIFYFASLSERPRQ